MPAHPLSQRIADVLELQPEAPAIEYDGQWISWARLSAAAARIAALTAGAEAGMLLRNRPGQVAAFLGVLLGGGTVVTINPARGDERTRADIAALRLPLIIGEADDLAALVPAGDCDADDFGFSDTVARPAKARDPPRSPAWRCGC